MGFAAGPSAGVGASSAYASTSYLNQRSRGSQVMTDRLYGKSKTCVGPGGLGQHKSTGSSARARASTSGRTGLTELTFMPTASEREMTAWFCAFGSPMTRSVRGSERKRKWWMPMNLN